MRTQLDGTAPWPRDGPENVARARTHQEHLRIVGSASQHLHGRAFDLVRPGADDEPEPVAKQSLPRLIEGPREQPVRDRGGRIRAFQSDGCTTVACVGARSVHGQDLGAPSREGCVPAIDDAVGFLEPVEEEAEPHAGLEHFERIDATGHRGCELGGQFAAHACLQDEVGDTGRQSSEHVLPHVASEKARGAPCASVRLRSADHHQPHRDGPALGLAEDGLGSEATTLPVEQLLHFRAAEAEHVGSDEALGVRQPMPRKRDLEQRRADQHHAEVVRRLLGEHSQDSHTPGLPCPVRIVHDQVHSTRQTFQSPADLLIRLIRVIHVAVEIDAVPRACGTDEQRIDHALSQQRRIGIERAQPQPPDVFEARSPIRHCSRLPESARGADHRQGIARGLRERRTHLPATDGARLRSRRPESQSMRQRSEQRRERVSSC